MAGGGLPPKPRSMDETERRLAQEWKDAGVAIEEIARRLGRHRINVSKALLVDDLPVGVGRKKALTESGVDRLVALTEKMVDEAAGRYMVTREMIQARFVPKVCDRVIANAQHERGIWMYRMREKPILTPEDVAARRRWAERYRHKTPSWWRTHIHLHIDNHAFKVPATRAARRILASRRIPGVYRSKGVSLRPGHVRPGRGLRHNTGVKNVMVAGGVGSGRVRLWHVVLGAWGADSASKMYSGPLIKALRKAHPRKRTWRVLEDSDPGGYQTRRAQQGKAELNLEQFHIPCRSPDLNVMDFYVWSEVERQLRIQERTWDDNRKESREDFIKRLQRTIRSLPKSSIDGAIGDLAWRARALHKAKGGLFEEGGRRGRRV